MTAYPFQIATLIGCAILIPVVTALWKTHAVTTTVGAIIGTIAVVYFSFYAWLLWVAKPGEYAWLSAALRATEIYALLGVTLAHLYWYSCRNPRSK